MHGFTMRPLYDALKEILQRNGRWNGHQTVFTEQIYAHGLILTYFKEDGAVELTLKNGSCIVWRALDPSRPHVPDRFTNHEEAALVLLLLAKAAGIVGKG